MRAEMLSRTSTCWLYLVAAMMMMNAGCSSHADSVTRTEQVRLDSVIEADELTRLLAGSTPYRPVILDVRDASAYEQGHVAGAVRVDFAIWKDESLAADTGLDHETLWRTRIGSLGVSGREPVVIYDDGRMTEAARVWFIFQHFGGLEAAVLNGGYPALAKLIEGHRIETSRKVAEPVSVKFEPKSTAATHM